MVILESSEGLGFDKDVEFKRFIHPIEVGGTMIVSTELIEGNEVTEDNTLTEALISVTSALDRLNKDVDRVCAPKRSKLASSG